MTYEIRTADLWPDADFELRTVNDEEGLVVEGYVAKFSTLSLPLSIPGHNRGRPFREVLEPGSFTRTISTDPDITLRFQHDLRTLPLARTKAQTMRLWLDEIGLRQRSRLPDNEWGRPVYQAIERRDIDGMSFRFTGAQDNRSADGSYPLEMLPDGSMFAVRRIRELKLDKEVSVTDMPAYVDTTVAAVRAWADAAEVDPDQLVEALGAMKPDARISPQQREALIAVLNAHSDAPVMDAAAAHKQAQMRERLAALAGK